MVRETARPTRLKRAAMVALLAVACVTTVDRVQAQTQTQPEPVRGEASLTQAKGYARLLLKFDQVVATEASVSGAILLVRFKQPVDLAAEQLAEALPAYVASARRDPDGMAIRFALAQKLNANLMSAGERIYIDLLPEKWTGLPPSLPPDVIRELAERAVAAERALRQQKAAEEVRKKPPVRVRVSVQPTFTRFVFDLPDGTSVSSSLGSQKYSLLFSPSLTFDLADAKVSAPPNIKGIDQRIEGDNAMIEIALIGEVNIRAHREDKTYVVDVGFEQPQKPLQAVVPPAAKMPEPPAAVAPIAKTEEVVPAIANQMAAESKDVKSEPPPSAASVTPEQPVSLEKSDAPPPIEQSDAQASKAVSPILPAVKYTSEDFKLTLPFDRATPAALFRRSDSLWIVLDSPAPIDVATIERDGAAIVSSASVVALPEGQALRLRLRRPQLVSLGGDDNKLVVTLTEKAAAASQPLTAVRNVADPSRAQLSVPLSRAGRIHKMPDPEAGDMIFVVTAELPARGLIRRQSFVEFAMLESIHGVVVQPYTDDLTAAIVDDRVIVSRPGGLTLSGADMMPQRAASGLRSAFNPDEWRANKAAPFLARRDKLIAEAASAPDDRRLKAHLDVARFYLSRGFFPEAKGALDVVLSDMKAGEEDAAVLMIHAAASVLSGQSEVATIDLNNAAISSSLDAQVWRGMVLAREEKWAQAREKFKNGENAILALPVDLQRLVLAQAMRASIEVRDFSGAANRGNDLDAIGLGDDQIGSVAGMRARVDEALGREADARTNLAAAMASPDRQASADAKLRDVMFRQKRNEVSDEDSIRELETLSVTWRGDGVELKTIQLLSRLYGDANRYGDAFAAWRVAVKLQPNSEVSRKAQDDTSALFSQVFLTARGDDLPPIEALALFYDYRDLTPIGRRGDEMIRRLADRLVAVDLLDQAGELLQYQIDHRLEGAARAQVAARAAMIYLMNRKPERAIAALRGTRIGDLAGELRQQRLLLEARAQSDIGRHDLALDIISNIGGREAVRLRSDIYWAARRWREASEQLELLLGERWRSFQPLNATEKSDIIRATVGYALSEDTLGLSRFREKYAAKMSDEADRAAFDIASEPVAANSEQFARIARMAATIDTLDGFLREMKNRFPEAVARAKLPPEVKVDTMPTGSLPPIVGLKALKKEK